MNNCDHPVIVIEYIKVDSGDPRFVNGEVDYPSAYMAVYRCDMPDCREILPGTPPDCEDEDCECNLELCE